MAVARDARRPGKATIGIELTMRPGTTGNRRMPRAKIPVSNRSGEETDEPLIANDRDYYKVEKWTKDGSKVERMLYAGSNLDKAREIFAAAIYHRPRIRLTIRQRSLVLEEWPKAAR